MQYGVRTKSAKWADTPKTFEYLEALVEAMRVPAKRLAVTRGNYHGTNDFAFTEPELWSGFVLADLRHDLVALAVVRAYALLSRPKWATDATLIGAAEILSDPSIRDEAISRSRLWSFPNNAVAKIRAGRLPDRLATYLHVTRRLDIQKLRDHRNWVVAHTTLNPMPPLTNGEVWEVVDATLTAFDHLRFVVSGNTEGDDVEGLGNTRREHSLNFWTSLYRPEGPGDSDNGDE